MRLSLLFLAALAACAAAGPDPRTEFTARNGGKTLVTYVPRLGTQAVYLDPAGALSIWSAAQRAVQRGRWRYDVLATGSATTYQGAAGVNHPVEELQTQWGICFQFLDAAGNVLRRQEGGDWNCALLADYEGLIIDRADGDRFALTISSAPPAMPAGRRLTVGDLAGL